MQRRCRGNCAWLKNSRKKTAIILSLDRPKTNTEIKEYLQEKIGLSQKSSLRLSEFVERNIMQCLNPRANIGRIYSLTSHGLKMAKRISIEKGIIHQYQELPIDYIIYAWMLYSPRRKSLLSNFTFKGNIRFKDIPVDTSRSYKYHLLNQMIKKKLINKLSVNGENMYSTTKKGRLIADYFRNTLS